MANIFKPLFVKKFRGKTNKKLEKISKDTGLAKWLLIDHIVSTSLGIETESKLDLKKWLKS